MHIRRRRALAATLGPALVLCALTWSALAAAAPATAGTACAAGPLTVTSSADTATPGTLRTALGTASGGTSAQTICIDTTQVTSTISIGSDLPSLSSTT